ncbi:ester cyclase [Haloarchaeobius sp. TZWWS8]|uniref:ester cyclase n=1 Tax=Haloarchaeobius sp. TZWWS8 TaxID=3446121 RepID=UPI003EB764BB
MPGGQQNLQSAEYERIVRRLVTMGQDGGDPTVFYEHVAPDCVLMSDPGRRFGAHDLAERMKRFHDAVPDVSENVENVHVDGETVVVRTTRTGTFEHEWRQTIDGEELVFKPTGMRFTCDLVYTVRFDGDQIVEVDGYGHNDLWFAMGIVPDPYTFAR